MALVNMDYNGKSVPEKIAKCKLFSSSLLNNANYGSPNPDINTLMNDTSSLEVAYTASQDGSKMARAALQAAEEVLDADISTLGAYIQWASGGDEQKILSAGALIKKKAEPMGELPAPVGLLAKIGTEDGTVECKWTSVKGAKSYIIQISNDLAGTTWVYFGSSPAARFKAEDLTTGKKYLFRVAALGAAGQSPWSDPAVGMAA